MNVFEVVCLIMLCVFVMLRVSPNISYVIILPDISCHEQNLDVKIHGCCGNIIKSLKWNKNTLILIDQMINKYFVIWSSVCTSYNYFDRSVTKYT